MAIFCVPVLMYIQYYSSSGTLKKAVLTAFFFCWENRAFFLSKLGNIRLVVE